MKIDSVGCAHKTLVRAQPEAETVAEPGSEPGDTAEPASSEEPVQDARKVPGVVRLIEAGHFKGVADIRLRLNFADYLDGPEEFTPSENVPGKAYGKFLALYQSLLPPAEPESPSAEALPDADEHDSVDMNA